MKNQNQCPKIQRKKIIKVLKWKKKSSETSAKKCTANHIGLFSVHFISISLWENRSSECLLLYNHMHFYAFIYKSHQITLNSELMNRAHTVSKPASHFTSNAQLNSYACVCGWFYAHAIAKGIPWFRIISPHQFNPIFFIPCFTVWYFAVCKYKYMYSLCSSMQWWFFPCQSFGYLIRRPCKGHRTCRAQRWTKTFWKIRDFIAFSVPFLKSFMFPKIYKRK